MKKQLLSAGFAVMALGALAVLTHADNQSAKVSIGAPAPLFSLQAQDGKQVNLADYSGKTVVLEWTNPECPFVQRHYQAKTMSTLANDYSDKDVVWIAINSTGGSTNSTNADWISKNGLHYSILNDSTGNVGHMYSAKTTPDMYIIDKTGKLVYSGAIDNDPQGDRASGKINYVRSALDEVLAGKPVTTPETKPYGCGVHYAN